jgi:hypothetical protein
MCAIIDKTSEEFDEENNPVINPANFTRGFNYRAEADTDEAIALEKIRLMLAEWEIIKTTVNGGGGISPNSNRRVLMGYQYALHRQNKHLLQERKIIRQQRVSASASSRANREARSNASHTTDIPREWFSGREPGTRRHATPDTKPRVLFLAIDEAGNINPKTPEQCL